MTGLLAEEKDMKGFAEQVLTDEQQQVLVPVPRGREVPSVRSSFDNNVSTTKLEEDLCAG